MKTRSFREAGTATKVPVHQPASVEPWAVLMKWLQDQAFRNMQTNDLT